MEIDDNSYTLSVDGATATLTTEMINNLRNVIGAGFTPNAMTTEIADAVRYMTGGTEQRQPNARTRGNIHLGGNYSDDYLANHGIRPIDWVDEVLNGAFGIWRMAGLDAQHSIMYAYLGDDGVYYIMVPAHSPEYRRLVAISTEQDSGPEPWQPRLNRTYTLRLLEEHGIHPAPWGMVTASITPMERARLEEGRLQSFARGTDYYIFSYEVFDEQPRTLVWSSVQGQERADTIRSQRDIEREENQMAKGIPKVEQVKKSEAVAEHTYIKMQAAALGVSIDANELESLNNRPIKEVNRFLMDKSRAAKVDRPVDLQASQLEALSLLGMSKRQGILNSLAREKGNLNDQVRGYYRQIETYLERMVEVTRRELAVKDQGVDYAAQVKALLDDGWYSVASIQNDKLVFTTPQVYCTHINTQHGINRSVYMGRYKIIIDMNRMRIKVGMLEHNLTDSQVYHPHVAHDGDVCWGNAHAARNKMADELDIVPAMLALKVILQTYNDASPYRTLERYEQIRNHVGMEASGDWDDVTLSDDEEYSDDED